MFICKMSVPSNLRGLEQVDAQVFVGKWMHFEGFEGV
jgi:hypothetical protein